MTKLHLNLVLIMLVIVYACSNKKPKADVGNQTGLFLSPVAESISSKSFNPSTLLWYTNPAKEWEEALPVGNGRLGAMVFGGVQEERIQLNEETYWSGGPYSTVVK